MKAEIAAIEETELNEDKETTGETETTGEIERIGETGRRERTDLIEKIGDKVTETGTTDLEGKTTTGAEEEEAEEEKEMRTETIVPGDMAMTETRGESTKKVDFILFR